ncbi:Ig-like domain-containing protein [Limibaculum sp. FT325]|uniref:Ig-like domain-containing protein n=1 Tax=Thermohalobaculum sediminis TaxID=2939436 RepID=UPI0020BFA47E|nr:Ig-like domain-containing protein [Limibaculum sediminis]MCL5778083.1 Ig-like domain-containing protein [Limibaculum sediminis]
MYQILPPSTAAADDSAATAEDQSVSIDVLANDPLGAVVQSAGTPAHGSTAIKAGEIVYTPDPNFNGTDSFAYTILAPDGTTSTAEVSVTVTAVNDAPEGIAIDGTTVSELALPGTVIGTLSATDVDGDAIGFSIDDARFEIDALGRLIVAAGADLSVDADAVVPVVITASDGKGGTATLSTGLTIEDVPAIDLAADDNAVVAEDGSILIDVLANDTAGLEITGFTQGAMGSVSVEDGRLRYTPAPDRNGSDSFIYTVIGALGFDQATVSVTVTAVNDAPRDLAFSGTTLAEDAAAGTVIGVVSATDPDGDPISFSVDDPRFSVDDQGRLAIAEGADFDAAAEPQITLAIAASDGIAEPVASSFILQVGASGALVVALVNTATDLAEAEVVEGAVFGFPPDVIDVLGLSVTVPDGSPLAGLVGSVRLILDGDEVNVENSAPYSLFGDRNGDFGPGSIGDGAHVLTIEIFSGRDATGSLLETQQIAFRVETMVAAAAVDDLAATETGVPVVIDVLANDFVPDGAAVITIVEAPLFGTVEIVDGEVIYVPLAGHAGSDSFRYAVSAGSTSGEAQVGVETLAPAAATTLAAEQLHLAWTDDAARTLTVVWRLDDTLPASEVQYRASGDTAWMADQSGVRPSGTKNGELHEATLRGLAPDTTYEFRVRLDDGTWSRVYDVTTAPATDSGGVFDLVFFADTGLIGREDGLATGTAQVRDEIAALDPTLLLGGGDYIYYSTDKRFGDLEASIDAWFDQWQDPLGQAPFMTVYGNHEVFLQEGFDQWRDRFPQVETGAIEGGRFHSFDVGDVHFTMILMAREQDGLTATQLAWIEADILAAQARGADWVIPVMHASPYSDGTNHGDALEARDQLAPLFESLGIDLVLTTHDQSYLRTFPLVNGSSTLSASTNVPTSTDLSTYYTESDGVVWMKVSPGGKLSNINGSFSDWETEPAPAYTAVRDNTLHHYAHLSFDGDRSLSVEVLGVVGNGEEPVVVDSFTFFAGERMTFANGDFAATDEDTPTTIDVLANDDPGTVIVSLGQPANGVAALSGGTVVYTPDPDFNGTDSFTYVASTPDGARNTAVVEVAVAPVNDDPSGLALIGTTVMPGAVAGTVVGSLVGSDVDGDQLTFSVDDPRFAVDASERLVVAEGADLALALGTSLPIVVTASDGNGGTATLEVTIVIDDAPSAPVLVAAINVGGASYTSMETGLSYAADPGVASGAISVRDIANDISGTTDDRLYQTYGFGTFGYDIAVADVGFYVAQFHFIEPWATTAGQRVFDIAMESVVPAELDDIDLHAAAGGRYAALELSATTYVDDGVLDIDFTPIQNNAIVSAISIFYYGA